MSDQSQGPGWWQASDGKWYPPQGQTPPPPPGYAPPAGYPAPQPIIIQQKKGGCFRWIGIAVVAFIALIIVAAIIAAAGSSDKKSGNSTGSVAAPHAIGETAHTGDFDVTLNGAQDPYTDPNQFVTPNPGTHFVVVDVTVKNTSNKEQSVSSLLLFDLVDATGQVQEQTIITGGNQIDGTVGANDVRRGTIAYRVGDSVQKPLKLRVKGELTSGGVTFTIP